MSILNALNHYQQGHIEYADREIRNLKNALNRQEIAEKDYQKAVLKGLIKYIDLLDFGKKQTFLRDLRQKLISQFPSHFERNQVFDLPKWMEAQIQQKNIWEIS